MPSWISCSLLEEARVFLDVLRKRNEGGSPVKGLFVVKIRILTIWPNISHWLLLMTFSKGR